MNICFESELKDTQLTSVVAINVFRLVQESLNNILKHSNASEARVNIRTTSIDDKAELEITISDNGKGSEELLNCPNAKTPQSQNRLGILGMKERVHLLQGSIQIHSEIGQGTVIAIRLPIFANDLYE